MQPGNHEIQGKYLRILCEHEQGSNEQKRDANHAEKPDIVRHAMRNTNNTQALRVCTCARVCVCTCACAFKCMCTETRAENTHTDTHAHARTHAQNININLGAVIMF